MALLPIGFAVVSFFFFFLLHLIKPKGVGSNYIRNWITVNIVFIFLTYPGITSTVFGMFSCMKIEDTYYLIKDFDIVCWESEHKRLLMRFTIPSAIIWVFGYPLVVFLILFKKRKNLNETDVLTKFGIFYIGFTDKHFYWQVIVINIRRLLYIVFTVSLQSKVL